MELSRRDLILKYIVEYFIKTATPVGSNTLLEQFNLPYSSATIRNEMMSLENLGYLEKTHTSSGRVPSAKGYRYYVSYLNHTDIDQEFKNQIATLLDRKTQSIEDVIKESCEILSHMTNLATVVLGPSANEEHLVSIQIIPISNNSATAVFVTDKGYVENKTFVLPEAIAMSEIESCVKMINERLKGTAISELVEKMNVMKPVFSSYVKSHDIIYQTFMEAFIKFASERVSLFGTRNLLDQPEFSSDVEKMKKMIKFLESKEDIADLLKDSSTRIVIGNEDGLGIDDVSVITTKFDIGGTKKGTIALVGPMRMDYEKVVGALDYVVQQLKLMFDDGKESKDGD